MDRRVCFFGHTHIPGVWTESGLYLRPDEVGEGFALAEQKVAINVGSVGQPRDGDNRACYVLFDGERVTLPNVPAGGYGVELCADAACATVVHAWSDVAVTPLTTTRLAFGFPPAD